MPQEYPEPESFVEVLDEARQSATIDVEGSGALDRRKVLSPRDNLLQQRAAVAAAAVGATSEKDPEKPPVGDAAAVPDGTAPARPVEAGGGCAETSGKAGATRMTEAESARVSSEAARLMEDLEQMRRRLEQVQVRMRSGAIGGI